MSGRASWDVLSDPRISWDFFNLVVMSGRISQDVSSCPRTSWDLDLIV